MTGHAEVQDHLLRFLRQRVFDDRVSVGANTDLLSSGFDSLSLLGLLLHVEEAFGVLIPESEINESTLATPATLAAVVVRLLDENALTP